MSSARPIVLVFFLLAGSATLGGCDNNGSFEVAWRFGDPAVAFAPAIDSAKDGGAVLVFRPGSCGAAGVSSISIVATRDDGTQSSSLVPCFPGFFTRSVPAGNWTVVVVAIDAEGHVKAPQPPFVDDHSYLNGQTTATVANGERSKTDQPTVFLKPLPQCGDGVDNDCDGRVDLDDPDCQVPNLEDRPDLIELGVRDPGCSTDRLDAGAPD
jgi:hypothetical protein